MQLYTISRSLVSHAWQGKHSVSIKLFQMRFADPTWRDCVMLIWLGKCIRLKRYNGHTKLGNDGWNLQRVNRRSHYNSRSTRRSTRWTTAGINTVDNKLDERSRTGLEAVFLWGLAGWMSSVRKQKWTLLWNLDFKRIPFSFCYLYLLVFLSRY